MGKKILWLFPLVILVFFYIYAFQQPKIDYFNLKPKDIKEVLVTVGRIEPAQKIDLAYQDPGIVQKIHHIEGDQVSSGDLLFELDNNTEKIALEQKKADLDLAYNALNSQNKEQYQTATEEYQQLSIEENRLREEYETNQNLFQNDAISSNLLENSRSAWEQALSRKKVAQTKLASLEKNGSIGQKAIINMRQAQLAMEAASIQLEKKQLFSPINGLVTVLHKEIGEYVNFGETVISLTSSATTIKGEIDEKELYRIKVGMEARVALLANPSQIYLAQVKDISPEVDPQKGTIEVHLSVLDDNFSSTPYAAVNIEIVIMNEKQAWAVPQSFVVEEGDKSFLWTWQEGKIIRQEISVNNLVNQWVMIDPLETTATVLEPGDYQEGKKAKLGQERSE